MLSRETSPRTNPMITAVPPSRETGPHTNQTLSQTLMKCTKKQVRCDECGEEHPTRICIHRSKRLREERERTTRPKTMTTTSGITKQRHALPKTVRFDASIEEISDTQPPTSPTSELVEKLEGLHIPSDDEADDEKPHQVNDTERTIPIQGIRDPSREAPNAYQDDDHHGTIRVQSIRLRKGRTTRVIDEHAE